MFFFFFLKEHGPSKCWRTQTNNVKNFKNGTSSKDLQKNIQQNTVIQENFQQKNVAQVADEEEEEQFFVASCFQVVIQVRDGSLIVVVHMMTYDQELFKELDTSVVSKVKVGDGKYIIAKGEGTVAIESISGTKLIQDVLFVPDLDQNLLSVG